MVRSFGTEAPGARRCGQADLYDEPRARVVSWPPLRLARLRRENHEAVAICDRNARPIENRSSQIELADAIRSKRRIDIQPITGETKRDKLVARRPEQDVFAFAR